MIEVKVVRVARDAKLPVYTTPGAAGMDVHACIAQDIVMRPGETVKVPTGLAMEVPPGYEVQVRSRSGLAAKGVVVANSPGTVDSDYRGEICVLLHNSSDGAFNIEKNSRIAQLVLQAVPQAKLVEVNELSPSQRGSNGFGSTGVR